MKGYPMAFSHSGDNRWTGTVSKNFKTPKFVRFVVIPSELHDDPGITSILLNGVEQLEVSRVPWLVLRESQTREISWSDIHAGSKIEISFDEPVDGVGAFLGGSLS